MNILLLSCLVTLAVALPQTSSNLCGTNERGAPRQAGDTWMDQCNRCRCTERLVPGCTRRFCNIDIELSTKTPELIVSPVSQTPELIVSPVSESSETRNNNNHNGGGVVNFPGANSEALTRDEGKVCIDSDGNKRSEGDSWKDSCNTCGCGPNGLTFCTQKLCIAFAEDKDQFLLTEDTSRETSGIPQCGQDGVKTCQAVNVDFRNLKDGQIVKLIQGSNIQLQVRKIPTDTTAQRQSFGFGILDGGEASMNINTLTGGAYGSIKPLTGDLQYSLEAVNPSGSVLISRDINYFNQFED